MVIAVSCKLALVACLSRFGVGVWLDASGVPSGEGLVVMERLVRDNCVAVPAG